MIEKTVEHEWRIIYEDGVENEHCSIRACNGDVSVIFNGLPDTLLDFKGIYEALGEAIQIAEEQNNG